MRLLGARQPGRPPAQGRLLADRPRDPLPTIPVPLRPEDGDARLDLRALLDRIYDESGYEDHLYKHEPDPALSGDDATWARLFIPPPPAADSNGGP